jgi:transposase
VPMSGHRTKRAFTVLATRRDWSASEKRRIVAEALEPGANVSAVARRHGVAAPLLYRWRKEAVFAQGGATGSPGPAFLPVIIEGSTPASAAEARPSSTLPSAPASLIEIVLSRGRVVRVCSDVDTQALTRIIAALEAVP